MNRKLRIAVPKGRLQSAALETFAAAGLAVPRKAELESRRLLFVQENVEWILVKDVDVPVYVEFGAADLGIAGLDQILEHGSDVYQPVELNFGRCRMMLIGAPGANRELPEAGARIATKYPSITKAFLKSHAIHSDIVVLQGSVELAVVLSLASYIVDLVETGETVRVHGLTLLETVCEVSPRLIVNKSSYRTDAEVRSVVERVRETTAAGLVEGHEAGTAGPVAATKTG